MRSPFESRKAYENTDMTSRFVRLLGSRCKSRTFVWPNLWQTEAGDLRSAFTLVEILAVVAIMGLLFALVIPAFNGLVKTKGVTRAVNDVSEMIDLARSEAMAKNTYVWLGFNAGKLSGNDQLLAVIARSVDGTPNLAATNLRFVTKVQKEDNVLLTNVAGLTSNVKTQLQAAYTPSAAQPEVSTFTTTPDKITISVNGSTVNFVSLLTFTPQGEILATATPSTSGAPTPFTTQLMLGFRRTNGGVAIASDTDSSAILLYGGTGQTRVFRP